MKHLILLFLSVTAATAFFSCKKASTSNPYNLSGTTWVNKGTSNGVSFVETLRFTSSTAWTDVVTVSGGTVTASGTYNVTPPTVTMYDPGDSTTQVGTIQGNDIYSTSSTGNQIVYVEQ
jgi:hypothetical protein